MEVKQRVKPENFNELPSSGQVYFYMHKARDSGEEFVTIPVRRGIAAIGINSMKEDKKSYRQTLKSLRVAIAMRREKRETFET